LHARASQRGSYIYLRGVAVQCSYVRIGSCAKTLAAHKNYKRIKAEASNFDKCSLNELINIL
jgi:hypothetical protein